MNIFTWRKLKKGLKALLSFLQDEVEKIFFLEVAQQPSETLLRLPPTKGRSGYWGRVQTYFKVPRNTSNTWFKADAMPPGLIHPSPPKDPRLGAEGTQAKCNRGPCT